MAQRNHEQQQSAKLKERRFTEMSEKEKKKRVAYRKNREKWIFAQSVIVVVLALAVLISALVSAELNKKYYNIIYKVFMGGY